ncbi:sel1 repeat family protein [Massilia sp. TWP1-3-3]|uniref:sel1 repeat family protein n=1 Tax=Massilia sp. TWP1-3-3 TaxID=2804573 RepID=UPI003CF36ADC
MSRPFRIALFCLACAVGGHASADELVDANAALQQKNYPVALKLFGKLASDNNHEAQLRLGEMYWYGEGAPLDRAKGDALFAQAAAGGDPGAVAATKLSAQRAAHAADIALWTGGYTGAELRAGQVNCQAPALPAGRSIVNDEIKRIGAQISAWTGCYNGFVANMATVMPPGKTIPGGVLEVMSEQELAQAKGHLEQVYKGVIAAAKADADRFIVQRDQWQAATLEYVKAENDRIAVRTLQAKRDLDRTEAARVEANSFRPMAKPVGPSK